MTEKIAPNARIEAGGKNIVFTDVQSVEVEEELNTASTFAITLPILDTEKKAWKYLDFSDFKLGTEVKIYMGFDKTEHLITGEITALDPSFNADISTIEIRGYDRLHRLALQTKTRTFANVKDSDIASTIAGDWGLGADVKNTTTKYPYIIQNNQNDLEFLLGRARRIRYEVGVRDKTLYFRESKEKDAASVDLEYLIDFVEFSASLSTRYEAGEVVVQGWDVQNKKQIKAKASAGKEVSKMGAKETGDAMTKSAFKKSSLAIVHESILDTSEAETIAAAQFNARLVETVVGEGIGKGNPKIRAGKTVQLKGIGRFGGVYYVTATRHRLDSEGYHTMFHVRRTGI